MEKEIIKYPKDEVYAITHPEEVLRSNSDALEKIYIEDYGKKYADLIKKRMSEIVYIFDSTPDIAFEFIVNNSVDIPADKYHKLEELYYDFMKVKKEAQYRADYAVFLNMCKFFNIEETKHWQNYKEIANLPIHAFAPEFINQLIDKEKIYQGMSKEQLKEVYLDRCEELKINPITDTVLIRNIIDENREIFTQIYNHILFSKSLFGEYLKKKFETILGGKVSIDDVIEYFADPNPYCLCDKKTLVFIPMIKDYIRGFSLNGIFLHENRHAIESSKKGIGIDLLSTHNLDFLNELRTVIKEIEDAEKIPPIFNTVGRHSSDIEIYEPYDKFLDVVANIFTKYSSIFDECAIKNNITLLRKCFGIKELKNLNNLLNDSYTNYAKDLDEGKTDIIVDYTKIGEQVHKLMTIAKKRNIAFPKK